MKHRHAKGGLVVVGVILAAFGLWIGHGVVTGSDQGWDLWTVVATFGPLSFGFTLAFPQAAERVLQTVAPYIAFIEDPEEAD